MGNISFMATKRKKQKAETVQKVATSGMESQRCVLVGTYKGDQLTEQLRVCEAAYQLNLFSWENLQPVHLPKHGMFTAVELFAGAGGLSIGFERAGIHVVIANEIMPDFAATLAANRLEVKVINEDSFGEAA